MKKNIKLQIADNGDWTESASQGDGDVSVIVSQSFIDFPIVISTVLSPKRWQWHWR